MPVDEPIASPGNAGQKPGGKAEASAPQRIIRIGGTVVNGQRLSTPFRRDGFVFRKHRSLAVAARYERPLIHDVFHIAYRSVCRYAIKLWMSSSVYLPRSSTCASAGASMVNRTESAGQERYQPLASFSPTVNSSW